MCMVWLGWVALAAGLVAAARAGRWPLVAFSSHGEVLQLGKGGHFSYNSSTI